VGEAGTTELTALLFKARENNRRLGVSGLLIHDAGSFFQFLEGDEKVVETLFERIGRDTRHGRVHVLDRGSVERVSFDGWSMGFVEGNRTDVQGIPGFSDFLRQGPLDPKLRDVPSRARILALAFREGRFRQFVDGR